VNTILVFEPRIGEDTVKHVLDEFIAGRRKVRKACNGAFTGIDEMSTLMVTVYAGEGSVLS
jgi:hypothetical protein